MVGRKAGLTEFRGHVATRLRERRAEIEADADVRIRALSDPTATGDPTYVEGLRVALAAAFDYAISGLEDSREGGERIPVALLAQARLAARSGVSLGTVFRRYVAGYNLFGDFVMQEAEAGSFSGAALQELMRAQAARFDRLIAAVSEEHGKEWAHQPASTEERRVKQVEGLLDGELVVGEEIDYDFKLTHVGAIATGLGGGELIRRLTLELDCRLLLVSPDDRTTWAWLGAAQPIDPERVRVAAESLVGAELRLALGEPTRGLSGWRFTHRQAKATSAVGIRVGGKIARYRDVAMVASIVGDDLFATSLRELFLVPLEQGRAGGAALLETLRAYFAADRNSSSAAAALGVSRQTVINRLSVAEDRLGRSISVCALEIEAALRLEEIERAETTGSPESTQASIRSLQTA